MNVLIPESIHFQPLRRGVYIRFGDHLQYNLQNTSGPAIICAKI